MERFRGIIHRKEPEPPFRRIVYQRTGNLAMTTELNQEAADNFMRAADMRRDIVITDSNRLPRNETVSVSSDTLALRAMETFRRIREIGLSAQSFYSTAYDPDLNRYEIKIHDKLIDQKIRNGKQSNHESYNVRFLKELNMAVAKGLASCVADEKLKAAQRENYIVFGLPACAFVSLAPPLDMRSAAIIYCWNLAINFQNRIIDAYNEKRSGDPAFRRHNREIMLPVIPVDRYALGKLHIARHRKDFIVTKN